MRAESETSAGAQFVLPLPVCESLCDGLVRTSDPSEALAHIEVARNAILGPGLLTVNLVTDRANDASGVFQLQRAWTSHAAEYPVGGSKRKTATPWTQQLLVRGEIFVGEGEAALAAVFDDSARISSMGLRSVINVPLLLSRANAAPPSTCSARSRAGRHSTSPLCACWPCWHGLSCCI